MISIDFFKKNDQDEEGDQQRSVKQVIYNKNNFWYETQCTEINLLDLSHEIIWDTDIIFFRIKGFYYGPFVFVCFGVCFS